MLFGSVKAQCLCNDCRQSLETEEGELEAGELCADSFSEPAIKRMRVAHETIV